MQSKFLVVVIGVVLLVTHSYQAPVEDGQQPGQGDSHAANPGNAPENAPPPPENAPPAPGSTPATPENPPAAPQSPPAGPESPPSGNPPVDVGPPVQAGGEVGGASGASTASPGDGEEEPFVPPPSMVQ
ncbi:hypothetical protein Ddc_00199 [Ditylenchus destructor]|nr:hypothetical protein Ddc_00199 [Ditylenchus destructor]